MSLNSGRISISLFNCALLLLQVASLADEPDRNKSANKTSSGQPEAGYIVVSQALVYSGPSDEYYPTQVLKQGAAVEVHSKTDNGWLGIRPPGGSFSWVPAADAYLLPGGKSIEITSKNSVSWIGSSLGTAKQYRWLVRLNVGEQLTRLGEEVIKDKDGKDMLWYKISPPNGEYRWIKSNAVSHEPPAQLVKQTSADPAVRPASAEAQKPAANRTNKTARPPTKKSPTPKSNTVKSAV
jgi:uncharacterized protein YgiM (DUF1202 family)